MSWNQIELGELMAAKKNSLNPKLFPEERFKLFSIPAYDAGQPEIILGNEIGSSKTILNYGDVLFSRIVPHIRRAWIVDEKCDEKLIGSGEWVVFRNTQADQQYLKYFLISDIFHQQMLRTVRGVGGSLLRANPTLLARIKIPLPPLAIQKKIAAVLEKADELRKKRQEQIKRLDDLLQATFLDMFGDPVTNPKGWEVNKLKNISTRIMSGNTPKGGQKNYVEEGITFFRSQNVWRNNLDLDDVAYITDETHAKMVKSSLKNKDILMTKTGRINTENSSLGRAAIYLGEDDRANINGHVYLIRLLSDVAHRFVLYILTTGEYREYIRSVCVGGIDKRQINKDHLEEFPIIAPPVELQKKFAKEIEEIESQKQIMKESLSEIDDLFNSLMQKAFKGELNLT